MSPIPGRVARPVFFALFAVSGFAGLIYESLWTHYLKLFLGHAAYAQTLVLALFMGGMAIGASLWLLSEDRVAWAAFMALYGFFVISSIDNVVKPLLISRGAALPIVLVLLGVLGGLVAFGFIGLFLGPVLLALGFSLAREWAAGGIRAAHSGSNPIEAKHD